MSLLSVDAILVDCISQGLYIFRSGFIRDPHGTINDQATIIAENINQFFNVILDHPDVSAVLKTPPMV